jgi:hypothetical protein
MGVDLSTEIAIAMAQSDLRRAEVALSQAQLEYHRVQRHLESLIRLAGQAVPGVYENKHDDRTLLNG